MPSKLVLATAAIAGVGLMAAAATASSLQFTIQATNSLGPLSELGDTTIVLRLDPSVPGNVGTAHFRCGATVGSLRGPLVIMTTTVDAGGPQLAACDETEADANLGPLAPGDYPVTATIYVPDGSTTVVTNTLTIPARGEKCNVDPFLNRISVTLANKGVSEFILAFENDSTYRAMFGDVALIGESSVFPFVDLAFPPLDDPIRVVDRLQRTGEFNSIDANSWVCFPEPPPDTIGTAIEYYNTALGHYFFTADMKEQQAIDAGMVGANWVRTGQSFKVTTIPGCRISNEGGIHPAYRFVGMANIGPNSHFFTVIQDECGVVRDRVEWHWMFEGVPFYASEPVAGACPAGYGRYGQPLYRAYNNGIGGDPNHRYSTDHAVIDAMVAQGWTDEGVAMCVTTQQ
jgi:hypothetical protein